MWVVLGGAGGCWEAAWMGWRAGGSGEWVARRVRVARDGGGGQSGSEGWGRGLGVRGVRGVGAEGWGRGCGWWGRRVGRRRGWERGVLWVVLGGACGCALSVFVCERLRMGVTYEVVLDEKSGRPRSESGSAAARRVCAGR